MNAILLGVVLTTATIATSATITNTKTASVYLMPGGDAVTIVRTGGVQRSDQTLGVPVIAVSFEDKRTWNIIQHVTLDKTHHRLTIDF